MLDYLCTINISPVVLEWKTASQSEPLSHVVAIDANEIK